MGKRTLKLEQEIVEKILKPLKPEFHLKDFMQVIVGASILAIPVGFTEETWTLSQTLPLNNIIGILLLSLLFIALFTFYNYHKQKTHLPEFLNRTLSTYVLAFLTVAIILSLIQKTPWTTDALLAFKRTVIVTFPASMSAAVADMIK